VKKIISIQQIAINFDRHLDSYLSTRKFLRLSSVFNQSFKQSCLSYYSVITENLSRISSNKYRDEI